MDDFLEEAQQVAIMAAKEAGQVILKHFKTQLTIQTKESLRSIVTIADKECDKLIRKIILAAFPDHSVVSEEDVPQKGNEYVWYVDPLDGTTNYSRRARYFCVSIALAKGDELLAAAIYDPLASELYTATKGKGAFLNGKKISVSKTVKFEEALIYFDIGYDVEERKAAFEIMKTLANARSLRLKGAGAMAICELASGIADMYLDLSSTSWDYSAGALIVKEAGGIVKDFSGNQWSPRIVNGVVASNNEIFNEIVLKSVRSVLK